MSGRHLFEVQVRRVAGYFRARTWPLVLVLALSPLPFIEPFINGFDATSAATFAPFAVAYLAYALYLLWFAKRQVLAMSYWIEGSTLRIDEGILLRKRKSIPLDRITDIVLVQGLLMRLFGVWALQIQTAGGNQQGPEGTLYGVVEPEAVRDAIMESRDRVVGTNANRGGVVSAD